MFDFSHVATRPGFLRVCFTGISLVAVGLTGAGINKSLWGRGPYRCSQSSCPSYWLVGLGLTFIIFSWLFGLAMLVVMISPLYKNWNKTFCFANKFGYPAFGLLLGASFILILTYLIQVAMFDPCKAFSSNCESVRDYTTHVFQPWLFAGGAVIALLAGILGIYIFKEK